MALCRCRRRGSFCAALPLALVVGRWRARHSFFWVTARGARVESKSFMLPELDDEFGSEVCSSKSLPRIDPGKDPINL